MRAWAQWHSMNYGQDGEDVARVVQELRADWGCLETERIRLTCREIDLFYELA